MLEIRYGTLFSGDVRFQRLQFQPHLRIKTTSYNIKIK